MSDKYPLHPRLTEEGGAEAQRIMDNFKPKITAMVDELLGDLYADVSYHVASDHWTNYRNELMDGFKGYKAGASTHQHDFKELRQAIYANNKEEIIKDLNQDLVDEVVKLKKDLDAAYATTSY